MDELTGFHHVALTVSDLDRSEAWYRNVLGFEVDFPEEAPERRACVMRHRGSGFVLGLLEHGATEAAFDPARIGLDHLGFGVGSLDDLRSCAAALDSHGVAHSGAIDVPPGAILNFKDPDGIALSLFWDRRG